METTIEKNSWNELAVEIEANVLVFYHLRSALQDNCQLPTLFKKQIINVPVIINTWGENASINLNWFICWVNPFLKCTYILYGGRDNYVFIDFDDMSI